MPVAPREVSGAPHRRGLVIIAAVMLVAAIAFVGLLAHVTGRDLDGARIVITTGQAGNPFDRHYNDQIDAWRSGGTVPLPFTAEAIQAAAVSTLTLAP